VCADDAASQPDRPFARAWQGLFRLYGEIENKNSQWKPSRSYIPLCSELER